MSELITIVIIIAVVALLMRAFKSFMTRRTKINLGVIQVLDDGALVESMNSHIKASSKLPFNDSIIASFFASYLSLRESRFGPNYHGLLSTYLFKWEREGLVKTELISETEARLTFADASLPTEEIELELYEILKANNMTGESEFDYELLHDWGKKVLALGEAELLETEDVAFDRKERIRFTRQGYDKSLSHGSFEKYFMNISFATFCEMDDLRQQQELSFALLFELTEEIEEYVDSNSNAPELLQIANRVWRVL